MKRLNLKYFYLSLTVVLSLVVLLVFKYFLKSKLISFFATRDSLDKNYYNGVFNNFELSIIIVCFIILLVQLFWDRLVTLFSQFVFTEKKLIQILVLYFLIQLAFILIINTQPISDSVYYVKLTKSLLKTGEYKNEYGNFTAFWPVGLPLLMFLIGKLFINFILYTKIFIAFFNSLSLYFIAKLFSPYLNKKQLTFFLFSFMLFPNNLLSSNAILTDHLFMGLFWIIIYLVFFKSNHFVLIGFLVGILIYLRSTGYLILPIIFIIFLWFKQNKLIMVKYLAILFISALVLAPWAFRNYSTFGTIILTSTNSGYNFLLGNHRYSSGGVNFNFEYDTTNPDEPKESKLAFKKAINVIQEGPIDFFLRLPKKIFFTYWRADSSLTWTFKKTNTHFSFIFISFLFVCNFILFIFIIFHFIKVLYRTAIFHTYKKFDLLLFSILLLFHLTVLIFMGNERFLIPIYPILFYYFSISFVNENFSFLINNKLIEK